MKEEKIKKGEALFAAGDIRAAEKHFLELLDPDQPDTTLYSNLGVVCYNQGRLTKAESFFLKAVSVKEDNLDALWNLSNLYANQNQQDKAEYYREKAEAIEGQGSRVLQSLTTKQVHANQSNYTEFLGPKTPATNSQGIEKLLGSSVAERGEGSEKIVGYYVPCALCTMPRSGTWYVHYFFEFLDSLLSKRKRIKMQHFFEVYHSLNIFKLHVHSIFPGFFEEYHGEYRERWNTLSFHHPGVNYGYPFFTENQNIFYPSRNRFVRIAYLSRNPLDQAVSLFHCHIKRDEAVLFYKQDGRIHKAKDASEFLKHIMIDSYIKQYFTYHQMRASYSDNLLMVQYENLIRNPIIEYKKILKFLGVSLDHDNVERALVEAVRLSAMDNLKKLERNLGRSIGSKQPGSHMHGGEIGKWKRFITAEAIEHCRQRLAEFGLSLDDFIVE